MTISPNDNFGCDLSLSRNIDLSCVFRDVFFAAFAIV